MTSVKVFDPAMCCSTGVCGPSVDPELARFAADLDWLAGEGVSVEATTWPSSPTPSSPTPRSRTRCASAARRPCRWSWSTAAR